VRAELDWAVVAAAYLDWDDTLGPAEMVARQLATGGHPLAIGLRVDPGLADRSRVKSVEFLLFFIDAALADHALSDDELHAVRHLSRVLRVEEGDFLHYKEADTTRLLCAEVERLFKDGVVSASEAQHQVKLQGLLGLGYDAYITLISPMVGRIIDDLALQLNDSPDEMDLMARQERFSRQVAALDTVFCLNPVGSGGTSGYVYVASNASMPGLIKVGRTVQPPTERVGQLSSATGVPTPFILEYFVFSAHCVDLERRVHAWLTGRGLRVAGNREFFRAPTQEVAAWLAASASGYSYVMPIESAPTITVPSFDLEKDALLEEAKSIVLRSGHATAAMLQEGLSIGYGRASRILDQLEHEGIVAPSAGNPMREVLVKQGASQWHEKPQTGILGWLRGLFKE